MVKLTIDGKAVEVPKNSYIIDAANAAGITIPTLCYLELHKDKRGDNASCRVCCVEVAGRKNLAPACATPVMEGMTIKTDTERVINARKMMLELLLSDHAQECLTCEKAGKCGLQDLCYQYDIKETRFGGIMNSFPKDDSNEFYVRDMNKCVNCRRCLPGDLPGYQKTANPDVIAKFEKAWGVKLSNKPGRTVTEIVDKAGKGDIKVLYIMGENPMLSDPDLNHVQEALEKTEFRLTLKSEICTLNQTKQGRDTSAPAASHAVPNHLLAPQSPIDITDLNSQFY